MTRQVGGERIVAAIIDAIIIGVATLFSFIFTVFVSVDIIQNILGVQFYSILSNLISLSFSIVYFSLIPYFLNGATIGKLILSIRVISEDGTNASFLQLLKRNFYFWFAFIQLMVTIIFSVALGLAGLSSIMSFLTGFGIFVLYIVLLVQVASNQQGQGFHDVFASTRVIHKTTIVNAKDFDTMRRVKDWADVQHEEEKKKNEDKDPFWD